jgi:hypothetical protein
MSFLIMVQLLFPASSIFEIVSDRTERGGNSDLQLTDIQSGLNFKGQVGAIQGSAGPVGFALARFPTTFSADTAGGTFTVDAAGPIVMSVVIGVSDSLNPTPAAGTMTYSASFSLSPGKNDIQFLWTQMQARIRGRLVPNAPKFQPEWAETFAIQVARSQQVVQRIEPEKIDPETFDPIQFEFTVLK